MAKSVTDDVFRILVPLDGSPLAEQVLPYAREIGGREAEIILFAVVPWPEEVRTLLGKLVRTAGETEVSFQKLAAANLDRARLTWLGDRAKVRQEVAEGDPAEQIVWGASAVAAEMIVMASHGRGAIGRWVFGSVADRVARTATTPVLIVHPREQTVDPRSTVRIDRLLVPFDGSSLATEAFPVVTALARRLNVPVRLVHALEPSFSRLPAPTMSAPIPDSYYRETAEAEERQANDVMERAVAHLRQAGIDVTGDVLSGSAFPALSAAIADGDLIVMTSHGRSGARRWLLGSVATKLIHHGGAPVVLVPSTVRTEAPAAPPSG